MGQKVAFLLTRASLSGVVELQNLSKLFLCCVRTQKQYNLNMNLTTCGPPCRTLPDNLNHATT